MFWKIASLLLHVAVLVCLIRGHALGKYSVLEEHVAYLMYVAIPILAYSHWRMDD